MPQNEVLVIVLIVSSEAEHSPLRVELRLVTDSEPISGHVRHADGGEHMFHGWLELMQLLEQVRANRGSDAFAKEAKTGEQG